MKKHEPLHLSLFYGGMGIEIPFVEDKRGVRLWELHKGYHRVYVREAHWRNAYVGPKRWRIDLECSGIYSSFSVGGDGNTPEEARDEMLAAIAAIAGMMLTRGGLHFIERPSSTELSERLTRELRGDKH